MIRSLFSVYLIIFTALSGYSQSGTPHKMLEWNAYYSLSWEDFRGRPGEGSIGDAGTAVKIKAFPYYEGDKIQYDVKAYFDRERSWARDKSPALLKHEQLHFDIAELYARKIRKMIHELRASGINDPKIYNAHIRKLLVESNEADERYDRETLHGAMSNRQISWEKYVEEELNSLYRFKKKKKVINARELKNKPHHFKKERR